jgi:hypothetical protein
LQVVSKVYGEVKTMPDEWINKAADEIVDKAHFDFHAYRVQMVQDVAEIIERHYRAAMPAESTPPLSFSDEASIASQIANEYIEARKLGWMWDSWLHKQLILARARAATKAETCP